MNSAFTVATLDYCGNAVLSHFVETRPWVIESKLRLHWVCDWDATLICNGDPLWFIERTRLWPFERTQLWIVWEKRKPALFNLIKGDAAFRLVKGCWLQDATLNYWEMWFWITERTRLWIAGRMRLRIIERTRLRIAERTRFWLLQFVKGNATLKFVKGHRLLDAAFESVQEHGLQGAAFKSCERTRISGRSLQSVTYNPS